MRILIAIVISSFLLGGAAQLLAYGQGEDFTELRSAHFIIGYQAGVDKKYVYRTKDVAEKYYNVITNEFNVVRDKLWLWENRAKVFIAKDKQSYIDNFPCSSWSAACVNYYNKTIYTYPDQERFISNFIHELTHIIFREYIKGGNYPLWLDEGIATYIQDKYSGNPYRKGFGYLKQKIKNNTYIKFDELNRITLRALGSKSEEYVQLFYLESFSIIHFIKTRYGQSNFQRFLYYLKKGYNLTDAFRRVAHNLRTVADLEEKWKKFYLG